MSNKLYSISISKNKWKLIIWTFIILGLIIMSLFSSTFFIPLDYLRSSLYSSIGGILIGVGFGLAYARIFKINGIDNE